MDDYKPLLSQATKDQYEDSASISGFEHEAERDGTAPGTGSPRVQMLKLHAIFLLLHFGVLSAFSIALLGTSRTFHACRQEDSRPEWLPASPANAAISYKPQKYQTEAASVPLIGPPSPELDAAWESLLQHSNIRISDQDLHQLGRDNEPNVELPDGGHAGLLYVFHDLHCLKRLHQYMFQDYYFPDLDEEQRALNMQHNMHCINQLRQSIMCHADTSVSSYYWVDYDRVPSLNNSELHQCVDFDKLYNWASERSVDLLEPGYLVHPVRGVSFPDGKGSRLGIVNPPGH
ncbi:hypothetical protein HD806DRAFT_67567 [Xylariaceae sp. AK1471]|nr:hypothetical protein HD806DRAFT_67567 [Xylariaceae sp. AK1471]